MLLKDFDWKVGDRVRVKKHKSQAEYTGEIIAISLREKHGENYLSYTIKISDKESVAATSREMMLIK